MTVNEINHKWAYALTPRKQTTRLILHHAASNGGAADFHRYHLSLGWAGIGYNYVVRKNGTIERGRPENMQGAHTKGWNHCSIGICFEGNFENETMSAAQIKAGQELVADIVRRYPGIVVGKHKDYEATACPGARFPYAEIVAGENKEPDGSVEESDEPSEWAAGAWRRAIDAKIIQGDDGKYYPREPITREELVTVLDRVRLIK